MAVICSQLSACQLTLILLTWTIWRAPTNASKWRMGFNSAFKGLISCSINVYCVCVIQTHAQSHSPHLTHTHTHTHKTYNIQVGRQDPISILSSRCLLIK